ncbi:endonuclease/exonuclease/phosphatase [Actinomadura craniellae]|uniref:Endonuclease/exonuclease/phosphatase n=1 Tax=Actinomadura craniellae TaxID=2231787 RepID=A0A365H1X1_9ACTN|nr:endonuclease/exonuclease/phosphatase family protein [Actinomadura craniellae]RAY13105.1 endonuclease/exonuclease/phosphatase [Actinomadura craniellae]
MNGRGVVVAGSGVPVRLLSYNVRSLRDDTTALARVVRGYRPDLVCVQEAPRFLGWRARRTGFARACGLVTAAGRRAAGLAVLAGPRVRPLHREYHLLARVPGLHRRGLAIAVVEIDRAPLIVASTHLDLDATARRAHAGQLVVLLERARRRYGAPVVLAGDFNERPGEPAWELLARRLRDGYTVAPAGEAATSTARSPRTRIDAVFADPEIGIAGCGVPVDPVLAADYPAATDHRPVLAELTLRRALPGRPSGITAP